MWSALVVLQKLCITFIFQRLICFFFLWPMSPRAIAMYLQQCLLSGQAMCGQEETLSSNNVWGYNDIFHHPCALSTTLCLFQCVSAGHLPVIRPWSAANGCAQNVEWKSGTKLCWGVPGWWASRVESSAPGLLAHLWRLLCFVFSPLLFGAVRFEGRLGLHHALFEAASRVRLHGSSRSASSWHRSSESRVSEETGFCWPGSQGFLHPHQTGYRALMFKC